MKICNPDYERAKKEKRCENEEELREEIEKIKNSNNSIEKIENHDNLGQKVNDVYEKDSRDNVGKSEFIFNTFRRVENDDPYVIQRLMKEPSRQSKQICERVCFNHIDENTEDNIGVYDLTGQGKNAFYLKDGVIKTGFSSKPYESIKSIDFLIVKENSTIWVAHKYTKEEGGAQDNQKDDGLSFLNNAPRQLASYKLVDNLNRSEIEKYQLNFELLKTMTPYFVFLADGDFYEGYRDELEENVKSSKNSFVLETKELLELLN